MVREARRIKDTHSVAFPAFFHDFHVFLHAVAVAAGIEIAAGRKGIGRQRYCAVPHQPPDQCFLGIHAFLRMEGGNFFDFSNLFFPWVCGKNTQRSRQKTNTHTRTNTFPEEDEVHDPARASVSTLNYRLKTRALLHSEGVYINRLVFDVGAKTLRRVINLPVDEGLDGTSLKQNLTNVPPDAPKSQIFIRKQRDWPHKQLEQSCLRMESSGCAP